MADSDSEYQPRAYLRAIKPYWWLIIGLAMVSAIASYGFSRLQTPVYEATLDVVFLPLPANLSDYVPGVSPAVETRLIRSREVATRVKAHLATDQSPQDLLKDLRVDAPQPEFMTIFYKSSDPEVAARGANAFAEVYLSYRTERVLAVLENVQEGLQRQIESTRERLSAIDSQLARLEGRDDDGLIPTLEAQRDILLFRLGNLQDDLGNAKVTDTSQLTGEILEPAQRPTTPFAPNHLQNALLGAILGGVVGLALALFAGFKRIGSESSLTPRTNHASDERTVP